MPIIVIMFLIGMSTGAGIALAKTAYKLFFKKHV